MQKIAVGAVAVLAISVAGGAVAATKLSSPEEESKAVVNDAASRLGVTPERLTNALKEAMKARVDAAVQAGRLTEAQADQIKERIDQSEVPMLGGPGGKGGHHRGGFHHHGLETAAGYLGMSEAALETAVEGGKTLAQVAKDRGKSVEGLVNALVADKKQRIDQAVEDGDLTKAEANRIVAEMRSRVTDMVNGKRPERRHFDKGFGFRAPPPGESGAVFVPDAQTF